MPVHTALTRPLAVASSIAVHAAVVVGGIGVAGPPHAAVGPEAEAPLIIGALVAALTLSVTVAVRQRRS